MYRFKYTIHGSVMGMFLSLPTMESVKHQNYELEVRLRRSSSSPYAAFVAYNEGGAVMT